MAGIIPGAGELILPNVSHFAMLQDPEQFNEALLHFLSHPHSTNPKPDAYGAQLEDSRTKAEQ
jgi:hypothetical protein